MNAMIELINISKHYSNKKVLTSINLSIYKGETLMLLGANGSGKSTLIKLIGDFIHPTSGLRKVNELQPLISYMPDRFPKHKFNSEEYLTHMGSIQGIKKAELNHRIKELHALFHLQITDQPIQYFSKGMLQKVNMMQAMLSKPDLLLLDEPFSGLDVSAKLVMVNALHDLKRQGVTIVISTHELAMLQKIADRVITVREGSLFEEEPQFYSEESVLITCRYPVSDTSDTVLSQPGIISHSTDNDLTHLYVREDCCDHLLLELLQAGGSIIEVVRKGA